MWRSMEKKKTHRKLSHTKMKIFRLLFSVWKKSIFFFVFSPCFRFFEYSFWVDSAVRTIYKQFKGHDSFFLWNFDEWISSKNSRIFQLYTLKIYTKSSQLLTIGLINNHWIIRRHLNFSCIGNPFLFSSVPKWEFRCVRALLSIGNDAHCVSSTNMYHRTYNDEELFFYRIV